MNSNTEKMTILTGETDIDRAKIMTLRAGISLEIEGFKKGRGRSCYAIAKTHYGLKGSRKSVAQQLLAMVYPFFRYTKTFYGCQLADGIEVAASVIFTVDNSTNEIEIESAKLMTLTTACIMEGSDTTNESEISNPVRELINELLLQWFENNKAILDFSNDHQRERLV